VKTPGLQVESSTALGILSMWVCPKCRAENQDISHLCWICGTSPDGTEFRSLVSLSYTEDLPTISKKSHISRLLDRIPEGVGMRRQFGIGPMLILIALFGMMFAVLKTINVHPIIYLRIFISLRDCDSPGGNV
jgi:hypothetical protein